jgi:hypothetical protein
MEVAQRRLQAEPEEMVVKVELEVGRECGLGLTQNVGWRGWGERSEALMPALAETGGS